jgi:hypothetical protein
VTTKVVDVADATVHTPLKPNGRTPVIVTAVPAGMFVAPLAWPQPDAHVIVNWPLDVVTETMLVELAYAESAITPVDAAMGVPAAEHVPKGQVTVTVVGVTLDTTHTLLYAFTPVAETATTLFGEKTMPHSKTPHVTVKKFATDATAVTANDAIVSWPAEAPVPGTVVDAQIVAAHVSVAPFDSVDATTQTPLYVAGDAPVITTVVATGRFVAVQLVHVTANVPAADAIAVIVKTVGVAVHDAHTRTTAV